MQNSLQSEIDTLKNKLNNLNLKIDHYILGETWSKENASTTKRATHKLTGDNVMVKIINKKRGDNRRLKREIKILKSLDHPNITKLYEVLETDSDLYLVMEYGPKSELFDIIVSRSKLTENDARHYFQQIIAGIEYCHNNQVAHRDPKPENLLVDENKIVEISDFSLSAIMEEGKFLKTPCGSPNYAAPEVILAKKYIGTEADAWCCGVTLFAMLAGFLPFEDESVAALYRKIIEGEFEMPGHFSPEAQDLVRQMLQPNVNKRIRFNKIKLHPWVKMGTTLYMNLYDLRSEFATPNEINEDIFGRIMQMEFSFEGLDEPKRREAIMMQKKDYDFVVAYNIMLHKYSEKQLVAKIHKLEEHELKV